MSRLSLLEDVPKKRNVRTIAAQFWSHLSAAAGQQATVAFKGRDRFIFIKVALNQDADEKPQAGKHVGNGK